MRARAVGEIPLALTLSLIPLLISLFGLAVNSATLQLEYIVTSVKVSPAREGWMNITVDIFIRNPQQVLANVPKDLGILKGKWKEYVYEGSIEPSDFRWLPPEYGFATYGSIEVPRGSISELNLQLIPPNEKPVEISLSGPWSPPPPLPASSRSQLKLGDTFELEKEWAITPVELYTRPYSLLLKLVVKNLSGYDNSGTFACQIMSGKSCWYNYLRIPLVPPFMEKEVTIEIASFKTMAESLEDAPCSITPEYHFLILFPDKKRFALYLFKPSIEIKPPVIWDFILSKNEHITSFTSLGQNVYMGSSTGKLYAFDSMSGKLQWEMAFPGSVERLAIFDEFLLCWVKKDVYKSRTTYDYLAWGVYKVSLDTGQIVSQITGRFEYPNWVEFAGADETAFYLRILEKSEEVAGSYGARVIVKMAIEKYDIESFRRVECVHLQEEVLFGRAFLGARVLVNEGIIYTVDLLSWCIPGYVRLRFLRWPSGEKIWERSYDEGPYWWQPPPLVIHKGTLYAVAPKEGLIGLDPRTGEYKISVRAYATEKFVISPERIYLFAPSDERGPCFAVDILEGKWNETLTVLHSAKPLGASGGVLFVEQDGVVAAIYENPISVYFPQQSSETVLEKPGPENRAPEVPQNLVQLLVNGSQISLGAAVSTNTVVFRAIVRDPDNDKVKLQVELRRLDELGGNFNESENGLKGSDLVASGEIATCSASGLIPGAYHWRARAIDEHGAASEWVDFGDNRLSESDFEIAPEWRVSLEPGDILLCRSKKSPFLYISVTITWTHVGLYVGNGKVVEATLDGVVETALESWDYPKKVAVRAVRIKDANACAVEKAIEFAKRQLGLAYDSCYTGKQIDPWSGLCIGWYCSELVWAAYKQAGESCGLDLDMDPDLTPVTPDEIAESNKVMKVGEHIEEWPEPEGIGLNIRSPVDVIVIDPDGLKLGKEIREIPSSLYLSEDLDSDGQSSEWVIIPELKQGLYQITVKPKPGAKFEERYSLVLKDYYTGEEYTLADETPIKDIPKQPYSVVVTKQGEKVILTLPPEPTISHTKFPWVWIILGIVGGLVLVGLFFVRTRLVG